MIREQSAEITNLGVRAKSLFLGVNMLAMEGERSA